ncbi:MAG TPA: M28 family peptidase [Longimicrobiales bacterium]
MTARRTAPALLFAAAVLLPGCASQSSQVSPGTAPTPPLQYGNPLKLTPKPTTTAITAQDLMSRLYAFADDSMQGRQVGREGNMKGTAFIAREIERLGLEPAGDNGTYFQNLPDTKLNAYGPSTLSVAGRSLQWNRDFTATVPGNGLQPATLEGTFPVIYGGVQGDTTVTPAQAAGKIIVFSARPAQPGQFGGGRAGGGPAAARYADAAATASVNLDGMTPYEIELISVNDNRATYWRPAREGAPAPAPMQTALRLTTAGAEKLFGRSLDGLAPGTTVNGVQLKLNFTSTPKPGWARNVVGIVRGTDPVLRNEYVAIGAHNDHVGYNHTPVDHDSAVVYKHMAMAMSIRNADTIRALTPEERAQIVVNVDSLRRIRPARMDSIFNGADDDGSGSMALLEIAEAFAKGERPKRSILFVWHTGEEGGLVGSAYYSTHPTVPINSIVAAINVDMIGRGGPQDLPGGGPDYLGVVGRNMLSPELGAMVEAANAKQKRPLKLDDRFDTDVRPTLGASYNNIYQRSDHYNYAKQGIPIAFFFTGLHGDYHQVTDEPQYIDYPHYTRITNYIHDVMVEVANNPKRPAVTKPVS